MTFTVKRKRSDKEGCYLYGIMKDGKLLVVGTAGELMEMTSADRFEDAFVRIVKGVQL